MLTGSIHVLVVSGITCRDRGNGVMGVDAYGLAVAAVGLNPDYVGRCQLCGIGGVTSVRRSRSDVVRADVCCHVDRPAWCGVQFHICRGADRPGHEPQRPVCAGPQLSFLAVASLVWFGSGSVLRTAQSPDRLEEMLAALRPWYWRTAAAAGRWAGWLMLTSAVVWLVTLPLVLNQFHVAAPIAIVIAPAIWLLLFAAMWSGLAMLGTALLIPPFAAWCGSICSRSLGGLEAVVHWAESVPAGHVWLPGPAWWWVVGFYVGLLVVMIWGTAILPRRWQLAALSVWILIGLVPFTTRGWTREGLECTVVAVGHGECVVLEAPTGETLLYDAGGIGSPEYATQSIASLLWDRGIMRIDGIVLSHADTDHYNAVPGLLERFRVGTVYVSPVMFQSAGDAENRGPAVLRRPSSAPVCRSARFGRAIACDLGRTWRSRFCIRPEKASSAATMQTA